MISVTYGGTSINPNSAQELNLLSSCAHETQEPS